MADDAPAAPPAPATVYWANMGPVSGFKANTWTLTPYPANFGHKKAYVKVNGDKAVALSPKCPHLSCNVTFFADTKQFVCPCHGASFSDSGAVISGPATSPLVSLQAKIDGPNVFVQSLTPPKTAAS
jgi:cytochrome b6-f complex iron-sulfur subunit